MFNLAGNKNTSMIGKTKPVIKNLINSNIEDAHDEASVIPCKTEFTCKPLSEYELPIPYNTLPSDAGGNVSLLLNIHTKTH